MALVTTRSSTIFIATGESTQVFHSVNEVPRLLRRRLNETTQSTSSATILIADKRGREELVRALQGEPSRVHCRLADTIRARQSERAALQRRQISVRYVRRCLELLVPLAIATSLWFLVDVHFQ